MMGIEGDYSAGESILLTKDDCPVCEMLIEESERIQDGLASGDLVEVSDTHPDYETIVRCSGVDSVPAVVAVTESGGFEQV